MLVSISETATPVVGKNYTLSCNATGGNVTTYEWRRGNVELSEEGPDLFIPAVNLSHAGTYSCIVSENYLGYKEVTIQSKHAEVHEIAGMTLHIMLLFVIVPPPDSVNLLSSKVNPIWPIGSNISLTCIVKLNPVADFSLLTAHIQLSRNENPLPPTSNLTINGTTFTYTTQLNSFERTDSGNYTCIATFRSNISHITMSNPVTNSINITTGKIAILMHNHAMQSGYLMLCRCLSIYKWNTYCQ